MSGKVQRIDTVVPIGEVGDGAVRVRYTPNPAHNRAKFEIEYAWSPKDVDTVYIGDTEHAEDLVAVLEEMIAADRKRNERSQNANGEQEVARR